MKPSTFRTAFALALLPALLAGCQHFGESRLDVQQALVETRPDGCVDGAQECPLVNIDSLTFADEPELNRLIDQRLRSLALVTPGNAPPATLDGYRADFLRQAKPGWSSYLQAKLRERIGSRVVIELSSYHYTGGAHGMPGRGFINYDLEQNRELKLADILLPGKEGAFWRTARQAHQRWLVANGHDSEFTQQWPFRQTSNIALLKDGVLLKYDVYSIAPYSSGHPEVWVGYGELKGVVRGKFR
jgi:hypothetical protein